MKLFTKSLFAALFFANAFANAPRGLQWQSYIQSLAGDKLNAQSIKIQFTILNDSQTEYTETHDLTTSSQGMVDAVIGSGITSDSFSSIDWSLTGLKLKVELDRDKNGSYESSSESPLQSVPYALYAANSQAGAQGEKGDSGRGILSTSIENNKLVVHYSDQSKDTLGTIVGNDGVGIAQTLTHLGDSIQLSAGGGKVQDKVNDADTSTTNEIQTLSWTQDSLSISSGNTIAFPASPWKQNSNYTYNNTDSIGIGTQTPIEQVHIMGSTTMATLIMTPNEPFSGDDAQIILTEDDDNTYNMTMQYNGGDNRLYFLGKSNTITNGPHMGINRDNGRVGIGTGTDNPDAELEVVGTIKATSFSGKGDSLTNVSADSLKGGMGADTNSILQWDGNKWASIPYHRVAFHASASAAQTVPTKSYDTLHVNESSTGKNFEYPDGVFDNSTYSFIAPVGGIYSFSASVLWDGVTDGNRCSILLRVNDADEVGTWNQSAKDSDVFSNNLNSTLELNANDRVLIRIYNDDSASRNTFPLSGKYVYFSGHLVFAK